MKPLAAILTGRYPQRFGPTYEDCFGGGSPEVYALETDDQMKSTRNKASREAYRENAELYKRWARDGK